jgi:hypothetical protein
MTLRRVFCGFGSWFFWLLVFLVVDFFVSVLLVDWGGRSRRSLTIKLEIIHPVPTVDQTETTHALNSGLLQRT